MKWRGEDYRDTRVYEEGETQQPGMKRPARSKSRRRDQPDMYRRPSASGGQDGEEHCQGEGRGDWWASEWQKCAIFGERAESRRAR